MSRMAIPSYVFASLATVALASAAIAAPLRVPQIPVLGGSLQAYLNSVGESINVNTDQRDVQNWATTVSGNSTLTLMIELGANGPSNAVGVYNCADPVPTLFQVFPGSASAGWFAIASFRTAPTRLIVNLFDGSGGAHGSTTYLGVDGTNFGFYLSGPGGTFFTQDSRNPGGAAQGLAYAGTGQNAGQWWLCFDDTPAAVSDRDFDDSVIFAESVNPTPVAGKSWGQLKRLYR